MLTVVVAFYGMSAISSWLFFLLGRRWWATLLRAFRHQERLHGPSPGLRRQMTTVSSILLGVSFGTHRAHGQDGRDRVKRHTAGQSSCVGYVPVEHCLSEMNIVLAISRSHPDVSTFSECLEVYYRANYPMVSPRHAHAQHLN